MLKERMKIYFFNEVSGNLPLYKVTKYGKLNFIENIAYCWIYLIIPYKFKINFICVSVKCIW